MRARWPAGGKVLQAYDAGWKMGRWEWADWLCHPNENMSSGKSECLQTERSVNTNWSGLHKMIAEEEGQRKLKSVQSQIGISQGISSLSFEKSHYAGNWKCIPCYWKDGSLASLNSALLMHKAPILSQRKDGVHNKTNKNHLTIK